MVRRPKLIGKKEFLKLILQLISLFWFKVWQINFTLVTPASIFLNGNFLSHFLSIKLIFSLKLRPIVEYYSMKNSR